MGIMKELDVMIQDSCFNEDDYKKTKEIVNQIIQDGEKKVNLRVEHAKYIIQKWKKN